MPSYIIVYNMNLYFSGYYVYVETSYKKENDTANLQTPLINFPVGGQKVCVRFWYHMYGQHVGRFNLYYKLTTRLPKNPLWTRKGSIVNRWVYAQIAVPRSPAFSVSSDKYTA